MSCFFIPQKRPGASGRGFIRVYAPDLAEFRKPQDAILSLLKVQQEAFKASPLLNVVYVGAGIFGCVPHGAAMITSVVVSIAVGACIKHQEFQRTNNFLDGMNEKCTSLSPTLRRHLMYNRWIPLA